MKSLLILSVSMMPVPGLAALTSDPVGSLRQQAVKRYTDRGSCLAALDEWVLSNRDEERRNPTLAPSTWRLDGPQRAGSSIGYEITRVSVQDLNVIRHTVAYIYARSCKGSMMTIVADGWMNDELLPPTSP